MGIEDYQVTRRKPAGYGQTRQGYRSDRTGLYCTWIEEDASTNDK